MTKNFIPGFYVATSLTGEAGEPEVIVKGKSLTNARNGLFKKKEDLIAEVPRSVIENSGFHIIEVSVPEALVIANGKPHKFAHKAATATNKIKVIEIHSFGTN